MKLLLISIKSRFYQD